jgi:hypothetical protein
VLGVGTSFVVQDLGSDGRWKRMDWRSYTGSLARIVSFVPYDVATENEPFCTVYRFLAVVTQVGRRPGYGHAPYLAMSAYWMVLPVGAAGPFTAYLGRGWGWEKLPATSCHVSSSHGGADHSSVPRARMCCGLTGGVPRDGGRTCGC